jgi:trehalose 6-phosphate synthase/phosphatase
MNTDVHDYVTCRNYSESGENNSNPLSSSGPNDDEGGVVVVSEFAGSARCFGGALIVNPFSKTEVAAALNEALTMADDERALKHKYNWNYVKSHTSFSWAEAFLSDLSAVVKRVDNDPVPLLDLSAVTSAYSKANKRLFFLDYDGTLAPIVRDPAAAAPSKQVITVLTKLASDPKNNVYVVSGRDKSVLESWLGNLPHVGLCCEHGSYIRHRDKTEWEADSNIINIEWRDSILNLMNYFTERTPGSAVEQKHTSIAWHYRNVDPQYSISQAQELMSHLKAISSKYAVDVLWGNKVIEARQSGVNKGGAVKKILAEHGDPDFIFCIGDDKTDEDMFVVVDKSRPEYFTVAVKRKPTQAKAFVREQREVRPVLDALAAL